MTPHSIYRKNQVHVVTKGEKTSEKSGKAKSDPTGDDLLQYPLNRGKCLS